MLSCLPTTLQTVELNYVKSRPNGIFTKKCEFRLRETLIFNFGTLEACFLGEKPPEAYAHLSFSQKGVSSGGKTAGGLHPPKLFLKRCVFLGSLFPNRVLASLSGRFSEK